MSSIEMSPVESVCPSPSLPLFTISQIQRNSTPTTEINSKIEKIPLKTPEKQISFEVKTNIFNRNIQVKTKQEDTICTTNQFSPKITCSTTNQLSSPKCIRIHQSPRSSS